MISPDSPPPSLEEREVAADPIEQFRRWFDEAVASEIHEPDAVALATATPDGAPSVRFVLLRGFDARGFRFFTHYASRKGRELAANPRAAMTIYWAPFGRQVRIEGAIEKTTVQESDEYFRSRPTGSRISAVVSPQSEVIPSREAIERKAEELVALTRHDHDRIARPDQWGGFRLIPTAIEFWLARRHRLHDRLLYRREASGAWRISRLAP